VLSAGACLMFRSLHQHLQPNIGVQLEKRQFAPLAQSVERIHDKEKPGAILLVP
jgi:hypothetical protein